MTQYAQIRRRWNSGFGNVTAVVESGSRPDDVHKTHYIDLTSASPRPPFPYDPGDAEWWYEFATATFSSDPIVLTPPSSDERQAVRPAAFWYRFTRDERSKLWAALAGVDLPGVTFAQAKNRWGLKAWLDISLRKPIDPTHPETIWAVDAMEAAGILAAGRADQILKR